MSDLARDIIMQAGWADCMQWAMGEPELRQRFEAESGMRWGKTLRDALINEQTGYTHDYCEAFTVWATRNLWGCPDGVPAAIAAKVGDWPEVESADG